ncbi:hypothetical protein MKK50_08825 [Methylobacterium sp. J-043]|uniref:hypothetical protein n=1 Tax=Methylorubrum TaxID=2282523 RepID=UPI0020A09CB7|nr:MULTISPECIES: hypothetical protein [Methylorubrum]MCJ2029502.1 hypothetical protein [Methylobacterium sp. J-043]MCP1551463.1 hypothetical protein [Methylorubrum zatmanii]MCP1556400.1 hypothetical protein [Methylorubrum extorquens]MCP1581939.1 hypothetical protein [Methylorubrum extorquens]
MKQLLLAASVAAYVCALASPAAAQVCGVFDPLWIAGHNTANATLTARVTTMGTNIATQRSLTLEMLLSAMKVQTAQTSTNGEREVNLVSNTQQAVASTLSQVAQRRALVDAREQYAIDTGQGVNACGAIDLMNATNRAMGNVTMSGRETYRGLDVAPGKNVPLQQATRDRLQDPTKTDAGVLFDPSASDDDRKVVIQAMAGLPMPKPTAAMPGSEADLMMLRARRVEALRSPALVSLSAVRAMSIAEGHEVGSAAPSPLAQLEALIGQYGGGSQYEAWSAGLAGQSEHGLLIELTRMRSMSLALRQQLIEQQARTSAVFGTILATQAGGNL